MKRLARLLQEFSDVSELGDAHSSLSANQRKQLAARLRSIAKSNERFFWIASTMVIVLFVAILGLMIFQMASIQVAMPVLGVTAAGLIRMMFQKWEEKTASEFLLALTVEMADPSALKTVVQLFSERLTRKRGIGFRSSGDGDAGHVV